MLNTQIMQQMNMLLLKHFFILYCRNLYIVKFNLCMQKIQFFVYKKSIYSHLIKNGQRTNRWKGKKYKGPINMCKYSLLLIILKIQIKQEGDTICYLGNGKYLKIWYPIVTVKVWEKRHFSGLLIGMQICTAFSKGNLLLPIKLFN